MNPEVQLVLKEALRTWSYYHAFYPEPLDWAFLLFLMTAMAVGLYRLWRIC